jgi:GH25 family lysozyme M1 (1,4-beta-N-acetylmuramidase)
MTGVALVVGSLAGPSAARTRPPGYAINGVDAWPGISTSTCPPSTNDWNQFRASGGEFVTLKATRGTNKTLSCFAREFPRILDAGLAVAPFHFYVQDSPTSGAAQADRFISVLRSAGYTGQRPGELPPILDFEWRDGGGCWPGPANTIIADAKVWLDRVEAAFGRKPIIYTARGYITGCLGSTTALSGYPLQVADWGDVSQPRLPPGSSSWLMWQYGCSNVEQVPGMLTSEYCMSVFNGTQADLDALANRGGGRTQFADIDGNGLDEIISIYDNGDVWAYRHLGGTWEAGTPMYEGGQSKLVASGGFRPGSTRFADLDGDGRDEIISVSDNGDVQAYRNLGGGWAAGQHVYGGWASKLVASGGFRPRGTHFGDLDGDGLDEIIAVHDNGDVWAYRNLASGWSAQDPMYVGWESRLVASGGFRPGSTRFADLDGDQRDEIVSIYDNGDVWAYRNLGGGWGSQPVYDGGSSKLVATGGFRPVSTRFADLDPDDWRQEIIAVHDNGDVWAYRNLSGSWADTSHMYDGASSRLIATGGFRP